MFFFFYFIIALLSTRFTNGYSRWNYHRLIELWAILCTFAGKADIRRLLSHVRTVLSFLQSTKHQMSLTRSQSLVPWNSSKMRLIIRGLLVRLRDIKGPLSGARPRTGADRDREIERRREETKKDAQRRHRSKGAEGARKWKVQLCRKLRRDFRNAYAPVLPKAPVSSKIKRKLL